MFMYIIWLFKQSNDLSCNTYFYEFNHRFISVPFSSITSLTTVKFIGTIYRFVLVTIFRFVQIPVNNNFTVS